MPMHPLRAFSRDRSGNIAVLTGLCATILIGVVAFAVDEGSMFTDRRKAQGVTDLAALAAAGNLTNAELIANATVSRNDIYLSKPLEVVTGTYSADPSLSAANRFTPASPDTADAVQVTLRTTTPTYFGRLLGGSDSYPVRTSAIAANTSIASFSLGSRLASLNGGIINQLLSQTLGGSISLTAMDYRSLADVRVDMLDLLSAIATEAKLTGPTYDSVLSADIAQRDAIRGLIDVATADKVANADGLKVLAILEKAAKTSAQIRLGDAIDPGPYRKLPLDQKPAAELDVSALDVLAAAARLSSGDHQVELDLDLDIPQIAKTSIRLTIGEPPVSSGWTAVGRPGSTVETAQTRLAINVSIEPVGLLSVINLPIYIDVATAKATLTKLTCPGPGASKTAILAVTPGIVDAWIADVPANVWDKMGAVGAPSPAVLTKIGLLSLTGKAHVKVGNQKPISVKFTSADIDEQAVKNVRTNDYLSSLTGSLIGDLEIGVKAGSLGIVLPGQRTALKEALAAVAGPVDAALYSILSFVGVGVGEADALVQDVRCDGAVLVH